MKIIALVIYCSAFIMDKSEQYLMNAYDLAAKITDTFFTAKVQVANGGHRKSSDSWLSRFTAKHVLCVCLCHGPIAKSLSRITRVYASQILESSSSFHKYMKLKIPINYRKFIYTYIPNEFSSWIMHAKIVMKKQLLFNCLINHKILSLVENFCSTVK